MAQVQDLPVLAGCPQCGGRVCVMGDEVGENTSYTCMGTAGEELSCGWAADAQTVIELVRPKKSA